MADHLPASLPEPLTKSTGRFASVALRVWLVLVAASLSSWAIALWDHHGNIGTRAGTTIVLALAYLKVYLVGQHFMELKRAPRPLRLAFGGYLLASGTAILAAFYAG